MEDGSPRNGHVEHLLQAEGLRAKLHVVVLPLPPFSELELDGKQDAVWMAFDDVAPAAQSQSIRPDRQRAEEGHPLDHLESGQIAVFVDDVAAVGVMVPGAPSFEQLQRGTATAIEEVVQERERQDLPFLRLPETWIGRVQGTSDQVQDLDSVGKCVPVDDDVVVREGACHVDARFARDLNPLE